MAYRKCPRCNLNYITDAERMCSVCLQETQGETTPAEEDELCSVCGVNETAPGKDLCAECLRERALEEADLTAAAWTFEDEEESGGIQPDADAEEEEEELDDVGSDETPFESEDTQEVSLEQLQEEEADDLDEDDEDDDL